MSDAGVAAGQAGKAEKARATPVWARRSTLVLLITLLALAAFGTTTQTWMTATLDPNQMGQAGAGQSAIQVQGSKAATTVTALALVALAGGLAAAIAGRIARWVITAIIVFASAGVVTAAATVLADPLAAAQGSIAAATGVSGSQARVDLTPFPVLAVVAGCVLALAALLILPASRYWKTRTKYDAAGAAGTAPAAGPVDEIDSWDRLSRGEDPT
ncbi:putative membrane protein (TIGR02234 family) [Arthrobacter ulcerisalmonis]|uniref:Trp biosynthesis-associated membrane protein n=1 Tax=Arthrobacter sp. B1I2 TaxID=3042263 RepID=UPI0027831168|nr:MULTISPECIES: Trp biosynthesis-associated membrane protein [Arthrobacter]MDQ0664759.1 putative membrane protein (TIGR02234 family) [Arthrobacter ulcerisalmonis]MDQ0732451.1 putative membrane protein (TIGR02234 family) [Arthrobacter sp. B1I2]